VRITRQMEDLRPEAKPVVLAIGSFDGVHRGHQLILRTAAEKALLRHGDAWVLTFDPHPAKVLKPDRAPPLITSTEHKLVLMEPFGLAGCIVMPFTRELASEPPEKFLDRLQQNIPTLAEVVVGANWTFGQGAKGNAKLLAAQAPKRGFEATVVEPVTLDGEPISSTRLRRAISFGAFDEAEEMLDRPFSILGTVVHGKQIGTRMGFPTANLDPHNEVRPPSGVYAVRARIYSRLYDGAAFISEMSSAKEGPSGFIVEVHLLDFEDDVYGQELEVIFVKRIRDVRRFDSRLQLKQQIALDVEEARTVLEEMG